MDKRLHMRAGFPYEFLFALLSHVEQIYNVVNVHAKFVRYAVS
jgi:hypothetical protein